MMRLLKIIGLTGGSGVGKAAVCGVLARHGAYIIDTDDIAHDVILRGQPAYDELLAAFGEAILGADGEIDRKALGALAFADEGKRLLLTAITHKYIVERASVQLAAIQRDPGGYRLIVIDAPLLVEANMHGFCDQVWAVRAGYDARVARIMARDGLAGAAAKRRIDAQMPPEELAAFADVLIDNDGTLDQLAEAVERLVEGV